MQDNYQHEFDEQFVNQAWAQMNQLLDQEMPVKGKRRPIFWLWWLSGALAIALVGGGIFYYSHYQSAPATIGASSSVAAVKAPKPEAIEANKPVLSTVKPVPEKGVTEQNTGPASAATLSPTPASPANLAPAPAKQTGSPEGSKTIAAAKAGLDITIAPSIPEAVEQPGAVDIAQELAPSPPSVSPLAAERLPVLEASAQLSPSHKDKVILSAPSARVAPLVRLAAEGGVFSQQFSAVDGYHAGLAAELHSRGSRFYLRSGIFYRQYHQDFLNSERLLMMQNSSWEQSNPLSNQNLLATASIITQTQYLSLPIGIGFQALPRLAIETSLQASQLIASRRQDTWSLAGDASLPQSQRDPNRALLYQSEQASAETDLRNTVLEVQAGVAYFPTHRLAMRLQYQYGLSDLLLSPYYEGYHRGLQFTLSYYVLR